MARAVNKTNNFQIVINGVPDDLIIQEFTPPEVKSAVLKYGNRGNLPDVKVPGKKEVGDATMKIMRPTDIPETWLWRQLMSNFSLGVPFPFFQIGFRLVGDDGFTSVESYICIDAFITEVKLPTFKRVGEGEITEFEVKIAMSDFQRVV